MTLEANSVFSGILMLLGGLGLFVYGMVLMGEGLQFAAGNSMRKLLETLTKNRFRGVLVGATVTTLVQSSSATTVMLIGFVNAGLMNFQQSVAVIFGANLGTTITAQIVAFNIKTLAFPCIGGGFLLYSLANRRKVKYTGTVLLGFGILFLGMELMKGAMMPLQSSGAFESWLSTYGTNWAVGLLLGVLITAFLQSSSATTGMIVAMGASGALSAGGVDPIEVAVPIILGCNIGTCITAAIASVGTSLPAQRVAVAHYLFNISGVLLFLPFIKIYPDLVRWVSELFGGGTDNIARQVAWTHTIFNAVMTLLWLPFITQFTNIVKKIRKGDVGIPQRDPLFLDPRIFHNPSIAFEMARKEITRMANVTLGMVNNSVEYLEKMDKSGKKSLLEEENIVDSLANSITEYLTKLSQESLTDAQSELMVGFMHAVNDVERIGDHAENIMYLAETKSENGWVFSEDAKKEMQQIVDKVIEMYSGIINAFESNDRGAALEYQQLEHEIDDLASMFRRNHIVRLNNKDCVPSVGVVFIDVLSNLERVGDLANNMGHVTTGSLERL